MKRVLHLAQRARGYTSPNPMVGALLVKEGRIIGEGYHRRYGEKHAEVLAIEDATEPVKGAVLYCNLEPCCHNTPEKQTPPCTLRIVREGIKEIVVSTIDPNHYVNGKGLAELRRAGLKVRRGVLAEEATLLNEVYFKFIQHNRPFIHLKIAQTLDGRIATRTGDSRWITDDLAQQRVHLLRHHHDAVLVGINTVRRDDPSLTVRRIEGEQPLRVVLDSRLGIPLGANLVDDGFVEKTIVFTTRNHDHAVREKLQERGIRVYVVSATPAGRVQLSEVLKILGELRITSLLVEGGAQIFTEFIQQRLFDKISVFIAPIIVGSGTNAVGDLHVEQLSQALRLEKVTIEIINQQVLLQGYRDVKCTFKALAEAL